MESAFAAALCHLLKISEFLSLKIFSLISSGTVPKSSKSSMTLCAFPVTTPSANHFFSFLLSIYSTVMYLPSSSRHCFNSLTLSCTHYIINFIDITPRFLPVFAEKFSFEYLRKSHKIPLFSNKLVTDYIRSLTLACTAA